MGGAETVRAAAVGDIPHAEGTAPCVRPAWPLPPGADSGRKAGKGFARTPDWLPVAVPGREPGCASACGLQMTSLPMGTMPPFVLLPEGLETGDVEGRWESSGRSKLSSPGTGVSGALPVLASAVKGRCEKRAAPMCASLLMSEIRVDCCFSSNAAVTRLFTARCLAIHLHPIAKVPMAQKLKAAAKANMTGAAAVEASTSTSAGAVAPKSSPSVFDAELLATDGAVGVVFGGGAALAVVGGIAVVVVVPRLGSAMTGKPLGGAVTGKPRSTCHPLASKPNVRVASMKRWLSTLPIASSCSRAFCARVVFVTLTSMTNVSCAASLRSTGASPLPARCRTVACTLPRSAKRELATACAMLAVMLSSAVLVTVSGTPMLMFIIVEPITRTQSWLEQGRASDG